MVKMGCGTSKKILTETPIPGKIQHEEYVVKKIDSKSEAKDVQEKHPQKVVRIEPQKYIKARFDPRVTSKYKIKAQIGRGAFSRVVRVEDKGTKQPYAIKMIEIRDGNRAFETELKVLRKVRHPYIIQLIEDFEWNGRIYLVMEIATGGELFDRIVSRGFFTERDATVVLQMVLEAVRYLHTLGITHRDLKPENLLYYHPGYDSKIMVTDFGLSSVRTCPEDETMRTTCGTPQYLAPEIVLHKAYTNSVDLWAVGVITYILLSGQMPFSDDNRRRLYRMITRAKFGFNGESWKDVSESAKDFINKLLVQEPSKRMSSEEALKHPWIVTSAASSTLKNLHGSFSQNWLRSRNDSAKSSKSQRSNKSGRSDRRHEHIILGRDGNMNSDKVHQVSDKRPSSDRSVTKAVNPRRTSVASSHNGSSSSSRPSSETRHVEQRIHFPLRDGKTPKSPPPLKDGSLTDISKQVAEVDRLTVPQSKQNKQTLVLECQNIKKMMEQYQQDLHNNAQNRVVRADMHLLRPLPIQLKTETAPSRSETSERNSGNIRNLSSVNVDGDCWVQNENRKNLEKQVPPSLVQMSSAPTLTRSVLPVLAKTAGNIQGRQLTVLPEIVLSPANTESECSDNKLIDIESPLEDVQLLSSNLSPSSKDLVQDLRPSKNIRLPPLQSTQTRNNSEQTSISFPPVTVSCS